MNLCMYYYCSVCSPPPHPPKYLSLWGRRTIGSLLSEWCFQLSLSLRPIHDSAIYALSYDTVPLSTLDAEHVFFFGSSRVCQDYLPVIRGDPPVRRHHENVVHRRGKIYALRCSGVAEVVQGEDPFRDLSLYGLYDSLDRVFDQFRPFPILRFITPLSCYLPPSFGSEAVDRHYEGVGKEERPQTHKCMFQYTQLIPSCSLSCYLASSSGVIMSRTSARNGSREPL